MVKAFFDTSVLVAVFYDDHKDHDASLDLLLRFSKGEAACGVHSLAEIYATLTRMPGRKRVNSDEAILFLGSIRERLTIMTLNEKEYIEALESAAALGIMGGAIYDMLLAYCAVKANAKTIYTWNIKDFKRFDPSIAAHVKTP